MFQFTYRFFIDLTVLQLIDNRLIMLKHHLQGIARYESSLFDNYLIRYLFKENLHIQYCIHEDDYLEKNRCA